MVASFLSQEFLLHIPCWLQFYIGSFSYTYWLYFSVGSFSYTSHAGFFFFFIGGVSLTHHVLASFLSGEFLLHIPWWLVSYLGSFSYTSRVGFIFIWGVCLTHSMLSLFFCGEFPLHIPCWLFFFFSFFLFYLGSFSYTSRAGFIFIWGVYLKHPVLASFSCGEFLLHIQC